jgi:hypothetical protein
LQTSYKQWRRHHWAREGTCPPPHFQKLLGTGGHTLNEGNQGCNSRFKRVKICYRQKLYLFVKQFCKFALSNCRRFTILFTVLLSVLEFWVFRPWFFIFFQVLKNSMIFLFRPMVFYISHFYAISHSFLGERTLIYTTAISVAFNL